MNKMVGTLRWVAYETLTSNQNSDEDDAKKPTEDGYESDTIDKRRISYHNRRNCYDGKGLWNLRKFERRQIIFV